MIALSRERNNKYILKVILHGRKRTLFIVKTKATTKIKCLFLVGILSKIKMKPPADILHNSRHKLRILIVDKRDLKKKLKIDSVDSEDWTRR